jgi:hypothetical protein
MAFVHQRSMHLSDPSARDRRLRGPTQSLHAHQLTVQDLLVPLAHHLLAHHLLALDQCVVACRPRQRRTTSLQVLTMLLHRSSPHSQSKHRRHLRHITSCHLNPTVSRTPTMVPRQAVCRLLHHRHLPDSVDRLLKAQAKVPLPSGVLPAHYLRCDQLLRTVQALLAMVIKDPTNTTLIHLPAAVLQVVLLRQHLRWWLPKQLHVIGMIVLLLPHQSDTANGKRTSMSITSRLRTTRSAKSLRSHTAVAQLLPTPCHHHRLRVTAHIVHQMLVVSTMATTPPKLLITQLRCPRWAPRRLHLAWRKLLSRKDPNSTSQPHATWMLTRTTMTRVKIQRRLRPHLSAAALVTPPPPTAHLTPPHQLSKSHRKTMSTGGRMSVLLL